VTTAVATPSSARTGALAQDLSAHFLAGPDVHAPCLERCAERELVVRDLAHASVLDDADLRNAGLARERRVAREVMDGAVDGQETSRRTRFDALASLLGRCA